MYAEIGLPGEWAIAQRLQRLRRSIYAFREEASFARQVLLVLGFAGLTGLSAQVGFVLPFTPVPVTGQVFGVLLASSVLGRRLGPASQIAYVGLGAVGVPWFAPSPGNPWFTSGGIAKVLGVTGGYLLGFIVASVVIGWVLDRGLRRRSFSANLLVLLLGVGIIYAIGAAQLSVLLGTDLPTTLLLGVVPFLPGDILKALLASTALIVTLPTVVKPSGSADPSAAPIGPRDYAAVAGVVAATWAVAIPVATSGWAPSGLVSYYLLAATACTVGAVAALIVRRASRTDLRPAF